MDFFYMPYINIQIIREGMLRSCKKASEIFIGAFEETALLAGVSDVIVVRWKDNSLHSSPILVCFGSHTLLSQGQKADVFVNDAVIFNVEFKVDKFGYLHPMKPDSEFLNRLPLRRGKNRIRFELQNTSLQAEIYLFSYTDQILVSDFDGTATKSDVRGFINNFKEQDYFHEGMQNSSTGSRGTGTRWFDSP